MAHRVISSDSEDEYDTPIQHRPIRSNQIIDSTDESEDSDNPDINSFSSSASSDIYSEPESSMYASLSPIQVTRRTMSKQRTIMSDDEEEESDSQLSEDRKPTSGRFENKDKPENNSVRSEASNSEVNSPGEEQREVSKETNKENRSPLPQNLPLEKPMAKPIQGYSQAVKPMNQTRLMPAKALPQPVLIPPTQNQLPHDQYHLAHTRPALLKQLDNVKVSILA